MNQEPIEANEQEMPGETEETLINESEAATQPEHSESDKLRLDVADAKDKYLRLYSEFENFRRRTSKEKLELVGTANEQLMLALLPVADDFQRAKVAMDASEDIHALKEGIDLIYHKFFKILENKGLRAVNATGEVFNADLHEAITQIPAPTADLKGKVVDEVEKGYYLNDKIIRFSKVVIGN